MMDRYSVIKYKGDTYVCTEEPKLVTIDPLTGVCAFSGFKKLYLCDPEKNTECKKHGCGEYCFKTFNPEFAKIDEAKEEN